MKVKSTRAATGKKQPPPNNTDFRVHIMRLGGLLVFEELHCLKFLRLVAQIMGQGKPGLEQTTPRECFQSMRGAVLSPSEAGTRTLPPFTYSGGQATSMYTGTD